MLNLYKKIYFSARRQEIVKAKSILKRIEIEDILNNISKVCWDSGIEYEIILKNSQQLFLKIIGKRESILFKFSKKDMIFIEEFENFIGELYKNDINKAVYITTGVFDMNIRKRCSVMPTYRKIKLIDKYDFIKDQLGIYGKAEDEFKVNRLKLFKYLPS
ncbi:hypothetical protein [Clostridium rectalis]|uniref:hypothetical protein n=1 Tax=Clostridium rectalis TaxID=2040295 RepID=UPI000F62E873|nr:hypothetical protein [Clostridium rectalis]